MGSYYAVKKGEGYSVYSQEYINGRRTQEALSTEAKMAIGFNITWSIVRAKEHCKFLNKYNRLEAKKIRQSVKRVMETVSLDEALFPTQLIEQFRDRIKEENVGSDEHLSKILSHFIFVQDMCSKLKLKPSDYKSNEKIIYKYFINKKISVNYSKRIVSILNRWGFFYNRQIGQFFDPVNPPKGRYASEISDSQSTKTGTNTKRGVREESLPLTPYELESLKKKASEGFYNWLKLSVWLGLRPEEVDSLKEEEKYKIEFNNRRKIHVISVYQPKLRNIEKAKRWKKIPLFLPEQKELIQIIESKEFSRPSYNTARSILPKGVTFYGGRKGFTDLMLEFEQDFKDISQWLGHQSIDRTWKTYKNKDSISFNAV